MTTLCATGKSSLDEVTPMYLWSYGNYRYEIEVKKSPFFSSNEVFNSSYGEALNKFKNMVDKAVLVWYSKIYSESVPNGLSYIARMLSGPTLSLLLRRVWLSEWYISCWTDDWRSLWGYIKAGQLTVEWMKPGSFVRQYQGSSHYLTGGSIPPLSTLYSYRPLGGLELTWLT